MLDTDPLLSFPLFSIVNPPALQAFLKVKWSPPFCFSEKLLSFTTLPLKPPPPPRHPSLLSLPPLRVVSA